MKPKPKRKVRLVKRRRRRRENVSSKIAKTDERARAKPQEEVEKAEKTMPYELEVRGRENWRRLTKHELDKPFLRRVAYHLPTKDELGTALAAIPAEYVGPGHAAAPPEPSIRLKSNLRLKPRLRLKSRSRSRSRVRTTKAKGAALAEAVDRDMKPSYRGRPCHVEYEEARRRDPWVYGKISLGDIKFSPFSDYKKALEYLAHHLNMDVVFLQLDRNSKLDIVLNWAIRSYRCNHLRPPCKHSMTMDGGTKAKSTRSPKLTS